MRAWNKIDSSILVILLLSAIALGLFYTTIPPEIPSHYGLNGKFDALSPKAFLWELYGFLVLLQLILYFASKINPRFYNYPFKVRDENRDLVYQETLRLLNELRIFTLLLFLSVIGISLFSIKRIPSWLFLLISIIPIPLTIRGIMRIFNANKRI